MSAALEAAERGASVLVASTEPGSSDHAQGGIAAAVGDGDSPDQHGSDTIAAGAGLCDASAVNSLTREAPAAIEWLANQGVDFDPMLGLEAAHSRPRIVHVGGDGSGAAICHALRDRLSELPGHIVRLDRARLQGLLVEAGRVVGARLGKGGEDLEVRAGATVLATGGYAGLFERSTTTLGCDGSGLVAAL